ncbi:MAG: RidA family protein [Chitinophagaceae bacterium]|jgi:enamine deaminase RidA (YjgF/YER057c/UK114 family)|nr:RidA family protein [Chitinophagaceae bacterium]
MARTNYSSGVKWEALVGYSRAVKVGSLIEVTGTVAVNDNGEIVGENNAYEQTRFILQKIERILIEAGAGLDSVIRTRMFVTDISQWQEYGRAHNEFFKIIRPCTSMIEISRLISPQCIIEIEATAVVDES